MENLTTNTPLTYESLMASIYENDRILSEKFAETDRLQKENDRYLKEKFAETDRLQKENVQLLKESRAESDRRQKENEQLLKESRAESDRLSQEREREISELRQYFKERDEKKDKEWANYERRMKNMEKLTGSWSNNHGTFAEEYFYNAFLDGEQNFFGEHFDIIRNQVHPVTSKLEDEYDIVLYNHSSVAIIEAKYTAHVNDIAKTLKKVETFRILCPEYKDFKFYLGLASMSFYPELEKKCTENGIAIIKQVGDMVVINDAHLKVF